jgi:hypothetical protein
MERPLKWRAFAHIQDWRLQQTNIDRGELIETNQQKINKQTMQ